MCVCVLLRNDSAWLNQSDRSLAFHFSAGVGVAMRKMGSMAKPDIIITKDGDTFHVKTESTFKTSEFSFKLGEKFNEETLDGRKTQVNEAIVQRGHVTEQSHVHTAHKYKPSLHMCTFMCESVYVC